jgi:purine-nucleoside phosphorylase
MSPAGAKSVARGSEFQRAERAARYILSKTKLRPTVGLVLGSGLGAFADDISGAVRIPYEKIPGFPRATAEGHAGRLVIGKMEGAAVAAMQGRAHLYEGYSAAEAAFPMRVFQRLGIRAAILTNAAGAIHPDFRPGEFVVIRDHINLQGANPLTGRNDERFGPRFPDMTEAYWAPYRGMTLAEAEMLGIAAHEGVYAAVSGPSYETPAEIGYLRAIGADLAGMSTVPEVIALRQMGIRVMGISCVTNMAAGISEGPIHHGEVIERGERAKGQLAALLRAVIPRIAKDAAQRPGRRNA